MIDGFSVNIKLTLNDSFGKKKTLNDTTSFQNLYFYITNLFTKYFCGFKLFPVCSF